MATTFTVTRTIKCWKMHECVDCGCEYRYRFERKIKGQGGSEAAALKAANKNLDKAVDTEVDVRPCPTCGRVQPDMVGQTKAAQHAAMGVVVLIPAILFYILGATYVLTGNLPSMILAAVFAGVALVNLLIAAGNPNKNLDGNLERADRFVDDGSMEVVTKGDTAKAEPPPGPLGVPHLLGIGFGLLAAVVVLAPMLYQSINSLPLNADTKPEVISPGDEVKVYFPDSIDCVKSLWKGTATATVLNANELGGPVNVTASSNDETWGNTISYKSSQKHTHPSLWARVRIPPEGRLTGKTVKVRVNLTATYPTAEVVGNNLPERMLKTTRDFDLTFSPLGAGSTYSTLWNGGVIIAGLLSAGACFYLRSLNKQLQLTANRPVVEPIKDDDEDDARPRNREDEDERPRRREDDDERPRRREVDDDRPRRRRDED